MRASSRVGRAGVAACCVVAVGVLGILVAGPARAGVLTDVQAAAGVATGRGYRTGVAVLDLETGAYTGAGEDTADFAAESVVKVLIATELLLTGRMSGSTATMAYQMVTESDDDDADALYGLAGGDDVLDLVAAHYGIADLGRPPSQPGWWGNTQLTAKGLVEFYAAVAKDPVVGPWLIDAMAHATRYGADGTDQYFGLPSATAGAAVKQGWGDDGDDSPNAVFDSTGFVDHDRYAVAILTDGPPSTYGAPIAGTVTAQAQALMPGGVLDPTDADPLLSGVTATAEGSAVHVTGAASDPDQPGAGVPIRVEEGGETVATALTGADSRFDVTFQAGDGSHAYTVVAVNRGEGSGDTAQALAPLVVDGDPQGQVLSVVGGAGTIRVRGVESDPNLPVGASPWLTVTVDGRAVQESAGAQVTTSPGSPVASYDLTLRAAAGRHRVAVKYLATGLGADVSEGSWTLTVTPSPAALHRRAVIRAWLLAAAVLLPVVGVATTALLVKRRRVG